MYLTYCIIQSPHNINKLGYLWRGIIIYKIKVGVSSIFFFVSRHGYNFFFLGWYESHCKCLLRPQSRVSKVLMLLGLGNLSFKILEKVRKCSETKMLMILLLIYLNKLLFIRLFNI